MPSHDAPLGGASSNHPLCGDALVLTLLGVTNLAVYDDSLLEWSADATLADGDGVISRPESDA